MSGLGEVTYRVVDDHDPDFVVVEVRRGEAAGFLYRVARESMEGDK